MGSRDPAVCKSVMLLVTGNVSQRPSQGWHFCVCLGISEVWCRCSGTSFLWPAWYWQPSCVPSHCHSALTAGGNSQNSSQTPASFLHEKSLNTERNIKCTHTHVCVCVCIITSHMHIYMHMSMYMYFLYMTTPTHIHKVYTCTIKALLLARERFFPSSNSTKVTEMFN